MDANEFIKKVAGEIVYIDVDGTLLESFKIGKVDGDVLEYWRKNLPVTNKINSTIELCRELKKLGCKLIVWTNRFPEHENITKIALGDDVNLFDGFMFLSGNKTKNDNYCIDNEKRYIGKNGLLIK